MLVRPGLTAARGHLHRPSPHRRRQCAPCARLPCERAPAICSGISPSTDRKPAHLPGPPPPRRRPFFRRGSGERTTPRVAMGEIDLPHGVFQPWTTSMAPLAPSKVHVLHVLGQASGPIAHMYNTSIHGGTTGEHSPGGGALARMHVYGPNLGQVPSSAHRPSQRSVHLRPGELLQRVAWRARSRHTDRAGCREGRHKAGAHHFCLACARW